MSRILIQPALVLVATLAWGCSAGIGDDDPFAAWPRQDAALDVAARTLGREAGPLPAHHRSAAPLELSVDGSLAELLRLASLRNPGIQAARQKVARLAERVPQVTSLADPVLQVAPFGEMAETAAGQVGVMSGLSQKIPAPGKLGARGRVAAQEVAVAVRELEEVVVTVRAEVRRAYWGHYFAARGGEVTGASRSLLAQFHQTAEAKFRAGTATQQDVLRASVELSNIDSELLSLRQQQATAVAMLNRLLNRPVDALIPAPAPVELEQVHLELEHLLADASVHNPSMRKVRERIASFRERLKLARLGRRPDLMLSANYVAVENRGLSPVANGDDQWWFGLGVSLPIRTGRLDAAEREANRGILENLSSLSSVRNRVAFRLQDALSRTATDQQLVILFRDVIVPQARQTVDASLSGYRTNRVDFLTLIDNWRKLLGFELMYHRNIARLEQDFADLQAAVGRDLERGGEQAQPQPNQPEVRP